MILFGMIKDTLWVMVMQIATRVLADISVVERPVRASRRRVS